VSDEIPIAPLIYDGLDPAPKPKPVVSEVLDVLGGKCDRVSTGWTRTTAVDEVLLFPLFQ